MDKERKVSKFSGDLNYIERLNNWFIQLGFAKLNRDITAWYDTLMVLGDELFTEMNETEQSQYMEFVNLYKVVENATEQTRRHGSIQPEFMMQLRKCELFLRIVGKKAGLQNKPQNEGYSPRGWEIIDPEPNQQQ